MNKIQRLIYLVSAALKSCIVSVSEFGVFALIIQCLRAFIFECTIVFLLEYFGLVFLTIACLAWAYFVLEKKWAHVSCITLVTTCLVVLQVLYGRIILFMVTLIRVFNVWYCTADIVYSIPLLFAIWLRLTTGQVIFRDVVSAWLYASSEQHGDRVNCFRSCFRELEIHYDTQSQAGNCHAQAAAHRSAADNAINNLIHRNGYKVFSKSMSTKDFRKHLDGDHSYFFPKDMHMVQPIIAQPTSKHVVKMIDVDYYLEPREIFTENMTVMYTFSPARLQRQTSEYGYKAIDTERWLFTIAGNERGYIHKIWDYSSDVYGHLFVKGFDVRYIVSTVDVLQLDKSDDRKIVCICPTGIVRGWKAYLAWAWFGHCSVSRLSCEKFGSFLVRGVRKMVDGVYTPLVNMYSVNSSVDVLVRESDYLLAKSVRNPEHDVASFQRGIQAIPGEPARSDALAAAWIRDIMTIQGLTQISKWVNALNPYNPAAHYTPVHSDLPLDEGKTSGRSWCAAWRDGAAYLPTRCISSDIACVAGRIIGPQENKRVRLTDKMQSLMDEFVELSIPEPSVGRPVSTEEVNEKQNRPTQRALYQRCIDSLWGACHIASFQKAESYPKPGPPRNISTLDTATKINYSAYMYPFTDGVLKPAKWYAFAKSPRKLANAVFEVCSRATIYLLLFLTDFSKFDATVNAAFRYLELTALLRFFAVDHHDEIRQLHKSQHCIKATTKYGVQYSTEYTRASGSPETAAFNSYCNAFIAYAMLRWMGFEPREAYKLLGLYGGDDGINLGDPKVYSAVCAELGIDVKVVKVGMEDPVTFLGRIYTNPRLSPNSMIDFWRCIGKLHLTCSNEKSDKVVARRKALSIKWTDPKTPFLGAWARAILRNTADLTNKEKKRVDTPIKEDVSWWYYVTKLNDTLGETFPQPDWEEMVTIIIAQVPDVVSRDQFRRLEEWLDAAKTFEGCTFTWEGGAPIFGREEAVVSIPIVLNGELRGEPKPSNMDEKNKMVGTKKLCLEPGCPKEVVGHPYCRAHVVKHLCTVIKDGKFCTHMASRNWPGLCVSHAHETGVSKKPTAFVEGKLPRV